MHMQYRTSRFGPWTTVDMEDQGVSIKTTLFSYAAASRLDFYVTAAEQSMPIPPLAWVQVWDDVGTDDQGHALSASNPLFFGVVANITPGAHANQVLYVCMDPTYFAAKSVAVMSLPYNVGGSPATGAVPRLVYNVKNTGDDDYGLEVAQNSTVAQILSGILDFCNEPLYQFLDASPASGPVSAYLPSDLTPMTYIPQEKMVWETITLRAAVEQVWRCEPRFRMFWNPGSHLWRFHQLNNPASNPLVTLYLNDSGLSRPYPVIGCEINPSFEDCVSAVSIYGPPNIGAQDFYWDIHTGTPAAGNLVPLGSPTVLEHYSDTHGMQTAQVYTSYQIYDVDKRAGSRTLLNWTNVPTSPYQSYGTRFPVFLASWDLGTTWTACKGVYLDFLHGTATFEAGIIPFQTIKDNGGGAVFGSTQTKFPPNAVKLVWAPFLPPLEVRYPSSGSVGTANSLFGLNNEYRIYDESLAIGREFGTPVTSVAREAQYKALAQMLCETRSDVIYTGQVVLAGIDYKYCRLNCQVNIADANGVTTGWESMNAVVTDVEYTYGDTPSTTLTFSGNWQELYGEDPAALRERLRIQSFNQYLYSDVYGAPMSQLMFGGTTKNYDGSSSPQLTGIAVSNPFVYVDQYGNRQTAGIS